MNRNKIHAKDRNGVLVLVLENRLLRLEIAPEIGGRICSLLFRLSGREFLWRNPNLPLQRCHPFSAYDSNFYGEMDELLPVDLPEIINGISYPDHGELWTMPLTVEKEDGTLILHGCLPLCGLAYERRICLEDSRMVCTYRITNTASTTRYFLWKLHAALAVQPGDRVICPARSARVTDPAWSHQRNIDPFDWPYSDGVDLSVIPVPDGGTEFLYLYNLRHGHMGLEARDGAHIECYFDLGVFPCCWYFASYGGMDSAYTAIIEPCTTMPASVNEAVYNGLCAKLESGAIMDTTVV